MRVSVRFLSIVIVLLIFCFFKIPVYAQTYIQPSSQPVQTGTNTTVPPKGFLNVDPNVPINSHEYAQILVIDVISAMMCQLTGIDPTNPQQPCLDINPATGKIGMPPQNITQQFGQAGRTQPQLGGALGLMSSYISDLYVPAISSSQYVSYLASNFGIVKPTYASIPLPGGGPPGNNCETSTFGYGFCGLVPIFSLWEGVRDFAYVMLTVLCIAIGIGVMLRFRVDPRTVMTLQNQIPRLIIAILLITFSYAIAGAMIDLMWTATYAGINFITSVTNTQVAVTCPGKTVPLSQAADQTLLQDPLSFASTIFIRDCTGNVHSGIFGIAEGVSSSFSDLIVQVIGQLLGFNINGGGCDLNPFNFQLSGCIGDFFLWLTKQLIKLVIIIALLIALFRLWFELIKAYVTFLIFVILGPLWIVFGLVPGRPLGFEKWLRIIFANLAAFPLTAFIIVLARVIADAASQGNVLGAATHVGASSSQQVLAATSPGANPTSVFIPPLVGNPNVHDFVYLLALGAIMIAPSIPGQIKERMKATGQSKLGATVAAGIGYAAGAATAPGRKVWENLNRRDQFGRPEGSVAIMKQKAIEKTPIFGRYALGRRTFLEKQRRGEDVGNLSMRSSWREGKAAKQQQKTQKDASRINSAPDLRQAASGAPQRRFSNPFRRRGGSGSGNTSGGSTPPPPPQGGSSPGGGTTS